MNPPTDAHPLPESARIVVIGGGVGGASVAYHLALRGERDVVLLERGELTSGSTFHSAGLVGQLRADPTLTRMNMYSVELYRRLQASTHPVSWTEAGGIKLASTPERLEEIRRQISWARTYDLPLVEISPAEVAEMFPLVDLGGHDDVPAVLGAAYLSSDGYLDPSSLCTSMAAQARGMGVRIRTRTRVLGIDTAPDPGWSRGGLRGEVRRVRTNHGDIECEIVVDCGGMFAAEIARMVGVRVPLVPMAHQYLVTDAMDAVRNARRDHGKPLPTLRDPDLLVYWRQEVDGLLMGGYERHPAPWTASATSLDAVPADFNGKLLPADWPRFEEITLNSAIRVPGMADAPIRTLVNGPEAFTPDNEFCLGPTEVPGFFVAAGFNAHGIAGAGGIGMVMADWILDGDPGMDLWHMDVRRFGPAYRSPSYTLARTVENYATYYDIRYPGEERAAGRPLRTSPVYGWHAEHGAAFGEKSGWERVNYYGDNEFGATPSSSAPDAERLRPAGWAGRTWSPATAAEHRATRERVGLFDETSFAKLEIAGPDAARLLERCCDNVVAREVGAVTYTQMLNHRGGIEADVTVTRLAPDRFLLVTGTAFGGHDLAWLRQQARALGAQTEGAGTLQVALHDVTGQYVTFALWGPRARDVLARCVIGGREALSDTVFPFMTSQELTVGEVPVRALRVTFVGELGWELYAPSEYGATLWRTLWQAGQDDGIVACGYRAIESLRLEKAYRVWSSDITPETTPYEAGLGFCVKLDHPAKPDGFIGDDALRAAKADGQGRRTGRRLACLTLDGTDPQGRPWVALGSEPVRLRNETPSASEASAAEASAPVLGRITSAGYGYTVNESIAYAYLPVEHAATGTTVEVDLFGQWIPATVTDAPLFDPKGDRLR